MSHSEPALPTEFFDLVDLFLNIANRACEKCPPEQVSAAMMFAASRYNACYWVSCETDTEMSLEKGVDYYRSQYEMMFRENAVEIMNESR